MCIWVAFYFVGLSTHLPFAGTLHMRARTIDKIPRLRSTFIVAMEKRCLRPFVTLSGDFSVAFQFCLYTISASSS